MPLPVQKIQPGVLTKEWKHQLDRLEKSHALSRLWQRDLSLWPSHELRKDGGKGLLNWLDLPDHLQADSAHVSQLAHAVIAAGFKEAVFLAISSSSLAAELVVSLALPTRGLKFHVLSRIEPSGLRALENKLEFKRTLFLIASKSGKNLEMHALLLYLLAKVKSAGLSSPGENFIAITEEGSYLSSLAREHRFRDVLAEPRGFRGRFSGVIHFGHLFVGLSEFDPAKIMTIVQEMRDRCSPLTPIEQNPAALLAAFLAAIAQTGFHRLIFRSSHGLSVFARRLVHLVGSSSCKEGKGIIPMRGIWIADPAILEKHCSECVVRFAGEAETSAANLQIPSVTVEMEGVEHIAAEVFKWEIATSLACSLIGVNPFGDPDFGDGRESAVEYIEQITVHKKLDTPRPRLVEGNLSLFVEGELRHEISSLSFERALSSFFALRGEDGYLAIQNYAWNLPEVRTRMTSLTERLGLQLGVPAQLVDGPWYLHLIGQCYKGGPRGGLSLMITCDPVERIEVPGAGYSFGDLVLALALGDFDAMVSRKRPVVRIHMTGPPAQALTELESIVEKALKAGRRKT
ncbi:MAG TPA: hypothetical protein VN025_13265 [Candidatus Dormibacteraeota bacterium]|nr:hypothetical protein [Candidatus Dormibacteraeota bacterium]